MATMAQEAEHLRGALRAAQDEAREARQRKSEAEHREVVLLAELEEQRRARGDQGAARGN